MLEHTTLLNKAQVLAGFANLTQARVILQEETSVEKIPRPAWPVVHVPD